MAVETALELKKVLFDAYGGFADKRLKKLEHDALFIVDDRGESDYDARGDLFLWFCLMFVTVEAADRVKLSMRGGVPECTAVHQWFDKHGAERQPYGVETTITPDNLDALDDLAARMAAIVRKPYEVRAYKYVVPRVAASLRHLRQVLSRAWS